MQNAESRVRARPGFCALTVVLVSLLGLANSPFFEVLAAPPATKPANELASWFADLANRDPAVRDQARMNLMNLSRADLPTLRNLVKETRPLAPAQLTTLRDIVMHVFLATEPTRGNVQSGFLGVQLAPFSPGDDPNPDDPPSPGVVILDRMPGFIAFKVLQNGDMIVGIAEQPAKPIRNVEDLSSVIGYMPAGQTVHLQIIRGGQQIQVPVQLDARPEWVGARQFPGINVQDSLEDRTQRAEEFWQQNFAQLVEAGVS
jgi:hypothetical protein